ncbi:hypothetical protein KM427_13350 [Nocardioides sp. LMS-CY]|uniref:Integral membrane protein n=1 Tax=Nocardioides soli TaxID=1036020 RepID=A0A7W4VZM8_9ACTN|nr:MULTISPECIES: hypothetical protein [Nocardioides]MBB3044737.1 hypothetical protein [Nocardioides soli]QWF20004.1 hypothetical protein KM427_13350 [Nocardioides sp. LMS-CY]
MTGPVGVERGRARVSAYVYGNILVLAAVLTATPHTIRSGHAVVVVLATTVTTYLAHVVAHAVGAAVGEEKPEGLSRDELRDAVPIMSSGSLPTLILALGALMSLDPSLVEGAAAAVVIVRLVGIGAVVDRFSDRTHRRRSWLAGAVVAGVSVLIVVLKLAFAH